MLLLGMRWQHCCVSFIIGVVGLIMSRGRCSIVLLLLLLLMLT